MADSTNKLTLKFADADDLAQVQAFLIEKEFTLDTPKKGQITLLVADNETDTIRRWLKRVIPGFTLTGTVELPA